MLPTWSDARVGRYGADLLVVPTDAATGAYDLWVAAPELQGNVGRVFLHRDAQADAAEVSTADLQIAGLSSFDELGTRLVPCADVSGDGLPDLVLTMPHFSAPSRWASDPPPDVPDLAGGIVVVRSELVAGLSGVVDPWDVGPVWWGVDPGEGVGTAVSCDHDVTGDGVVDIAIGAPWADSARGRVYLVSTEALPDSGPLRQPRGATGTDVAARVFGGPNDVPSWFGSAVTAIEAPGSPAELAVGAPNADASGGRVWIYAASTLAPGATPSPWASFVAQLGRTGDHVGRTLGVADLDADDAPDLVIGAWDYAGDAPNAFDAGAIFAWSARTRAVWGPDVPVTQAAHQVVGNAPFLRIGRRFVAADTDGDGAEELWVPTRAEGIQPP
ncbi:MAG: integrin alpha [Myxococcota bacterium]